MATVETPQTPQTKLTKANPLARKLNKILNTSLEDPQIQDALETLAEFYTTNTLSSRRNLRGDIERRAMVINRQFLELFEGVNEVRVGLEIKYLDINQLGLIEKEIKSITECCEDMGEKLESAKDQTSHLMKQTQELKSRSLKCKVHQSIVDAFLARFTLSEEEVQVLTSTASPVGSAFFEALKHLQQINEDCKALLITEHQKAGLEIMETMAMYQETAYEKLFRWGQAECRSMNRDSPEVTPAMKDAMRALKRRPVLFQTIVDEVSHTRRAALVRAFIDALTRGGPGGYPRPIELHAHDSLRYVGDMLAWLHQAAASEREMLEGLFDVAQEARRKSSIDATSPVSGNADELGVGEFVPEEAAIIQVLDKNLEGTCRPLRVRIEQVLSSQPGAITAYRITNLIQFYSSIILKVIGSSAQLALTLEEVSEAAFKAFMDALNAQASHLLRFVQAPHQDLMPPPAVKDTVLQLKEIMASYDSSLVTSPERDRDFGTILTAILDPLLQMCVLGSTSLSALDNAIYMVNCLHFIQAALSLYHFTSGHVQVIESQIEAQVEVLVQEESGLSHPIHLLDTKPADVPLSSLPGMDAQSIAEAMSRLDTFLCGSTTDVSSSLARVTSSRIARVVGRRGGRLFVEAYRRLAEEVMKAENGYENPASLVPRTVAEVETLLSLGEDED
ncbi:Golgi transport complex subunit 6 [Borealophlyctis nickersoniae]|nr:Golgi transport complex subunit 6 [Borealophlyctis nickersoniae]